MADRGTIQHERLVSRPRGKCVCARLGTGRGVNSPCVMNEQHLAEVPSRGAEAITEPVRRTGL